MSLCRAAGVAGIAIVVATAACDRAAPEPYVRLSERAPVLEAVPTSRALLVTFWATWCNRCREESDELLKLARDPPEGLSVVVLSEDEKLLDVQRFFGGTIPNELHLRLDADWRTAHSLFVHQLPASVLLVDGKAIARFDGARRWSGSSARSTLSRLITSAAHSSSGGP